MTKNKFANISDKTSAMQRYFDTFRRSEYFEPEKLLLAAILEDAIQDYRDFRAANDKSGKARFHEAERWLMGEGDGWIFSFDNVCDLLGLDRQYIRHALREIPSKTTEKKHLHREPGSAQFFTDHAMSLHDLRFHSREDCFPSLEPHFCR
jgi:hypothetical protein